MSRARKRPAGNPARQVVTSTGLKVEAAQRFHTTIPTPAPGQHLWATFGVWRVADPAATRFHLDLENLLTLEGPGCFLCEQQYTPELAARPCPGDPNGAPL